MQVDLGGAFHSRRLKLVSSQVGQVSPGRRPRWDYRRRLDAALRLLAEPALDALVAEEIAFEDAPRALPRISGAGRARSRPRHPLPERLTHLETPMYAVEVRDRIMIAHSLPDPFFGPAPRCTAPPSWSTSPSSARR